MNPPNKTPLPLVISGVCFGGPRRWICATSSLHLGLEPLDLSPGVVSLRWRAVTFACLAGARACIPDLEDLGFPGFLVGSSDDEEAARITKQRMIGQLTKNLTHVPQTKKGPNFVRKNSSPAAKQGDSALSPKGKSPLNPHVVAPIHNIQYPVKPTPAVQDMPRNFHMHPAFSLEAYNAQLLA